LTDLNRPGEAIQEINKSIELNDNVAMFRGRQSLDQDRAVRNYDLARAYDQLDLNEWAVSKAVTAVKNDPYNSSAHLFLRKSYEANPRFLLTAFNEDLLFRLLAPANQSTFFSIDNDNYTPMFEMPYIRVLAQGGIGAWREKNSIWDNKLTVYGGLPGFGGWAQFDYFDNRGFRSGNGHTRFYGPEVLLKWEPTVKNSLFARYNFEDVESGDDIWPNDWTYKNSPFERGSQRQRAYELGYVHRFNPKATLVTYFTYQNWDLRVSNKFFNVPFDPLTANFTRDFKSDREFFNFQAQQNVVLGQHSLIGGVDYFSGHRFFVNKDAATFFFGGVPVFNLTIIDKFRPPEWSYSFYLLDYWRIHPNLLLELGVVKDFAKNAKDGYGNVKYNSMWSPIVGLNWYVTPKHTLRLGLQRHLITHQGWAAGTLLASETAGFPWLINFINGMEVRQLGAAWEAEWDSKTFTALRLEGDRLALPVNQLASDGTNLGVQWVNWKEYRASLTFNRILSTSWGFSAGILGKRVVPDVNDVLIDQSTSPNQPGRDFSEINSFLNLAFLHRTGLQGGIRGTLVRQYVKDRNDPLFGLVDLRLGYEFPGKRGLALLEVTNLFDRHFSRNLEPFIGLDFFRQEIFPARRIMFKLAFYF
ncbi:MAG: iron dicitrate transport regulator FecR, partial [Deltaproteobacteria bacterium]|nr:iron dicitrate transport regulator FecR [Deltaproteobacteria bacterium]